jgi:hypothetical protein
MTQLSDSRKILNRQGRQGRQGKAEEKPNYEMIKTIGPPKNDDRE